MSGILISALKLSQYRDFWNKWKGKKEFQTTNFQDEKEKFVLEYIEKHKKDFNEDLFKKKFISKIKTKKKFRNTLEDELESNISKYLKTAYKEWGFDKKFKYLSEKEFYTDEDVYTEVINYIIDNGYVEDTEIYKTELENAKTEFDADQINDLTYDAIVEFNQIYATKDKSSGVREKQDISNLYSDLFKGKYRIYFDLVIEAEDIAYSDSKNNRATKYNYKILDAFLPMLIRSYYLLLGKEEEASVVENYFLAEPREAKKNYTEGYYVSPLSNTKISIGKIFNLVKKKLPNYNYYGTSIKDLEKVFNTRPSKFKGKVVISRHPYDIAGMSTDRGWSSCMNLVKTEGMENYSEYVEPTIMRGALIAYLIKDKDKNINSPTSRLLIKPYIRKGETINYAEPNWVLFVSDIYGTVYPKFAKAVQRWVNENWNNKILENSKNKEFEFLHDLYKEKSDKELLTLDDLNFD